MDPNKQFAELAGICWHEFVENMGHEGGEICKHCWKNPDEVSNPNFKDPREVLRVMMKRDKGTHPDFTFQMNISPCGGYSCIGIDYILDTTGKLRDAAIKFLSSIEKEKK